MFSCFLARFSHSLLGRFECCLHVKLIIFSSDFGSCRMTTTLRHWTSTFYCRSARTDEDTPIFSPFVLFSSFLFFCTPKRGSFLFHFGRLHSPWLLNFIWLFFYSYSVRSSFFLLRNFIFVDYSLSEAIATRQLNARPERFFIMNISIKMATTMAKFKSFFFFFLLIFFLSSFRILLQH